MTAVTSRMNSTSNHELFIRQLTASHNALLAYILTLLPDMDRANDVLQETHVEMWRKIEDFVPGTNFVAWACTIARFKVLEARGRMRRDRLLFDDELLDQLAIEAEPCEVTPGSEASALDDCLRHLPPRHRELLQKRYAPGGSVKKLAGEMGRSTSGLAVTLFRIRNVLLDCIQRKTAGGTS